MYHKGSMLFTFIKFKHMRNKKHFKRNFKPFPVDAPTKPKHQKLMAQNTLQNSHDLKYVSFMDGLGSEPENISRNHLTF